MSETVTHFDCDARTRAITPPELTIGGIRYHGQLLSILEWMPFFERLEELQRRQSAYLAATQANRALDETQDGRPRVAVPPAPALWEWVTLHRNFLRAVFPKRLRNWKVRLLRFDPVRKLERAPDPAALSAAFALFFGRQLRAMQGQPEAEPGETTEDQPSEALPLPAPGNTSSGSTTPAGDAATVSAPSA